MNAIFPAGKPKHCLGRCVLADRLKQEPDLLSATLLLFDLLGKAFHDIQNGGSIQWLRPGRHIKRSPVH